MSSYRYLGVAFTSRLIWTSAKSMLAAQAVKSLISLYKIQYKCLISVETMIYLFRKKIVPILVYAAEIWGSEYCKQVESVQINFCKRILGLSNRSSNAGALGECGLLPLQCIYHVKWIKYWLKILCMDESSYPKQCYLMLKHLDDVNRVNWVTKIRLFLFSYGFGFVWMQQGVGNISEFITVLSQRIEDCAFQNWHNLIESNGKLEFYQKIKSDLSCEKYLLCIASPNLRQVLAKFRCSDHKLRVETGRHEGLVRELRFCEACFKDGNKLIDDEYHMLVECKNLAELRAKYLPKFYLNNPSEVKCIELISTKSNYLLKAIALFLKAAMKRYVEVM